MIEKWLRKFLNEFLLLIRHSVTPTVKQSMINQLIIDTIAGGKLQLAERLSLQPTAGATVPTDKYNVKEWYARHYGDEIKTNTTSYVNSSNGWFDPLNKHQSYYLRQQARKIHQDNVNEQNNSNFSRSNVSRQMPNATTMRAAVNNLYMRREERIRKKSDNASTTTSSVKNVDNNNSNGASKSLCTIS